MSLFSKRKKIKLEKIWKIKRNCLELIFECAKSNHPREFGGFLRIDENAKDTISELVILPGTISGDYHAIFKMHMLPIDFTIVGTVHSHPSPYPRPSEADLNLFQKHGKVHIIVASPYNEKTWRAYNSLGQEKNMQVV
jgi:proteasome lid subunit RPN8/RPN11